MSNAQMTKPRVGIIYSCNRVCSAESMNLAKYLGAHLAATGYPEVYLMGYEEGGSSQAMPFNSILYVPNGQSKAVRAPESDVIASDWSMLPNCHVVIVAVNSSEAEACGEKIIQVMPNTAPITVFMMIRGVRSGSLLKEMLSDKTGLALIECVVGFAVVPRPSDGALVSTVSNSGLMMERLSREIAAVADGAVNLMECMPFSIQYKKVLTPYAWGLLQYECLYSAATLFAEGTLAQCGANSEYRLISAAMIHETRHLLTVAARGGTWKPDMSIVSSTLSPWIMELILLLPYPLFYIASMLLMSLKAVPSPASADLCEKRHSAAKLHLYEFIASAERHHVEIPVCKCVYNCLERMDAQQRQLDSSDLSMFRKEAMDIIEKSPNSRVVLYWSLAGIVLATLAFIWLCAVVVV